MIVVAGNAHDFRAENVRAQNFGGLEIGRDEDPGLETFAGGMCGHGVGQVSGRGAGHGIEPEGFRLRQSYGDHAVFEA